MKRLVIGFGNTLRRDDGVGVAVAERVRALAPDGMIDVLTAFQLLPEHAQDIAQSDRAVLVDASVDSPAGEVRSQRLDATTGAWRNLHGLSAASLAQLVLQVYGVSPVIHLVTVGTTAFEFGEGLSPPVEAAVTEAAETVLSLLADPRID